MDRDPIELVAEFHQRIRAEIAEVPRLLPCNADHAREIAGQLHQVSEAAAKSTDLFARRIGIALEELAEWAAAHATGDLVAAADAWARPDVRSARRCRSYGPPGLGTPSGRPYQQHDESGRADYRRRQGSEIWGISAAEVGRNPRPGQTTSQLHRQPARANEAVGAGGAPEDCKQHQQGP